MKKMHVGDLVECTNKSLGLGVIVKKNQRSCVIKWQNRENTLKYSNELLRRGVRVVNHARI